VHPILVTNRILWAAILFSSVLFLVVLLLVSLEVPEPPNPVLLPALAAGAVMLLIMSRIVPGHLQRQAFAREQIKIEQAADPHSAMANYRGAAPTRRVISDREGARLIALRAQQSASIVALALSEAVGLLGFALGMIGFGSWQIAPFFVVSWLAILSLFPTERRAVRALERHAGATLS
jgi:hypothetical protein